MKEVIRHILDEIKGMIILLDQHIGELLEKMDQNNEDIIYFKEDPKHNLSSEFECIDNRLRFIFMAYVSYVYRKYKYRPTVTHLFRTQEEQDAFYGDNVDYQGKPWHSVHEYGRGLDFRSTDMSKDMTNDTFNFFKQVRYSDDHQTLIRHSVKGDHFHLQVNLNKVTEIVRI